MRKLIALTFVGFMCSGLAGCGSGGGSGGGDGGGGGSSGNNDTTMVALCTDAVNVLCTKLFQCTPSGATQTLGASYGYTDVNDCKRQLGQDRCDPSNAYCPTGTYKPAKAPACIAAFNAMTCDTLSQHYNDGDDASTIYGSPPECQTNVVCSS